MIKEVKCKVCSNTFKVIGQSYNGFFKSSTSPWNRQICSNECKQKNCLRIAKEQAERKKKKVVIRKCKVCKNEVKSNEYSINNFCGGLNGLCYKKYLSDSRKETNNPNFKNGLYTHKNFQNRKSKRAYKHLNECRRYKKEFIQKYGYQFCEVCKVNKNGTPKFEVHHIYFASLYPQHKNLHNNNNLIHICLECHHKFHAGKTYEKEFKKLEKERGLKELFNKSNKL